MTEELVWALFIQTGPVGAPALLGFLAFLQAWLHAQPLCERQHVSTCAGRQ